VSLTDAGRRLVDGTGPALYFASVAQRSPALRVFIEAMKELLRPPR
jgi:hypothetical protein